MNIEIENEVAIIHRRTEAIARLWKHFYFTIDHIESILDLHQGDVSRAFESLNNFVRFGGANQCHMITNKPDPLPVNDQCMGGLKFHCLECGCLVNWVDRHGTCTECLPF